MRNKFGETVEKEKKIEQLRTIKQEERTYDEYIQEFKKIARGSNYEKQPLIEEFKRRLSGALKRKLAEIESPSSTIEEWQERVVKLDRNQRQSRAKERILERNTVCLQGNIQPRRGIGEGSYKRKGGQIIQRARGQNFRGGVQNNWRRQELGRDSNVMNVDKKRGRDRTCYMYGKQGHMARNCWQRKERERRVVETLQKLTKNNRRQ